MAGKWPAVASLRVSTMCPSRIDRAVSAIGSLWSSPSTSTVYSPVIEPVDAGAGLLQQLRHHREDARRVAAGGRRLAGGQADLALGHGGAGDRVHEQQHVAALVAERLGDPGGHERGLEPHQRRLVRGGDDDDRAGHALGAEVLLEELAHLAATLADQADDPDVGVGAAGDLGQQAGLADAGAGEDAQALALAAGHEGVQRADAEGQRLLDPGAGERVRRLAGQVDVVTPASPAAGRRPPAGRGRRARGRAAPRRPAPAAACRSRAPGRRRARRTRLPSGMQVSRSRPTATTSASRPRSPGLTSTRSPTAAEMPSTVRVRPIAPVTSR